MMTKQTIKLSESLTRKRLMQLELLTASIVPAAAILVVAVAGSAIQFNPAFFVLDVLSCAIAVFFGERSIILRMQSEMDEQLSDLITACRAFIQGNKQARVLMPGDDQLALLASSINSVFDHLQTIAHSAKENTSANHTKNHLLDTTSEDIDLIKQQLEQLVEEISPALDGDLRVESYLDQDACNNSVAIVADLCNALVEKLVQFSKWTLYASTKMIKRSRNMLDRSIELVQTTEAQMLALGTIIAAVEKLVAFIQRMGSALQLNLDMAQTMYTHLQASQTATNSDQFHPILEQLTTNTQRQLQLLEEMLESTHTITAIADSAIGDLYAFAQQFHQSSTTIIKTAEKIHSMITLAEDWFNEAEKLALPADEE